MCVGAEKQMTYFVRDRKSKQRRRIGSGLSCQPLHAIDEHRRQFAFAGLRVDQGVSELKQPVPARLTGQSCEADRHLGCGQWRFASSGRAARPAEHPGSIDAGGSQDPGRRTQSDRLIYRRHHRHVVHTRRQLGRTLGSAFRRGVYDTCTRHCQRDNQCKESGVPHLANVRRGAGCLNALEVTRGETLVT
jgi:hypothetical protein